MVGKVIQVAKIPRPETTANQAMELLAALCLYYPAYTLRSARNLPYKDVVLMMRVARREIAKQNWNLTQIAAAPHTKKGAGVKKLSDMFKDEAK